MATGAEVLEMLLPDGGWYISGDSYENIQFLDCQPITKEEFEAGFAIVDDWKTQKKSEAQSKRQAILDRLGITEEEARLILG